MSKYFKKASSIALLSMILFSVFSFGRMPRSLQASTSLTIEAKNNHTEDLTNSIDGTFRLRNSGSEAVDLSDIKIRYYYTINGIQRQNFTCLWAQAGLEKVTGTFSPMADSAANADYYLEIGFTDTAGVLAAGSSTDILWMFSKIDWTNFIQTDDYSFGTAILADSPRTPVYLNGTLVYGTEPETPPVITHSAVSDAEANVAIPVTASIADADAVTARVYYGDSSDGSGFTDYVTMIHSSGDQFAADLPGADAGDLYYYIQAADSKGNIAQYPSDISACSLITIRPSFIHNIKMPFYAGQIRTIDGIVTYAEGGYSYVQEPNSDEDGDPNTSEGMAVEYSGGSLGWNPGDRVTVKGTITQDGSRLILVPASSSDALVDSSGYPLPDPFNTAIPSIGNSCEGMRIRLENVTIGAVVSDGNTPLYDQNGNMINIDHVPALTGITTGDRVSVTAIAVGGTPYHLMVGSAADVTWLAGDTTAPTFTAKSPTGANASISTSSIDMTFDEIVKAASGKVISVSDRTKTYTADVGAVLGSSWFGNTTAMAFSSFNDSSGHSLALDPGAEYTVTVPAGAFSDIAGLETPLATWTFTVEPVPLTPSVTPLNLAIKKGSDRTLQINLGQGADAANTAMVSSLSANILATPDTLTSNGAITIRGMHAGTAEVLITFNDPLHTVITVNVTVASSSDGSSSDVYNVSALAEDGGSIRLSSSSVARNSNMFFEVTPDPGYQISGVWVNDVAVGPVTFYEVKNITSNIFVKAVFNQTSASWSNPFTDVQEKDWFYEAVAYVSQKGLFHGTGSHLFSADKEMSRAMFVSVLANMDQADIRQTACRFQDVAPEAWYAGSIAWAEQKGIVSGVGRDRFAPDRAITRQEMTTILHNYTKLSGLDVSDPESLVIVEYDDRNQISDWAIASMRWAIHEGLLFGKPEHVLDPQGLATRAEAAAVVQRFCLHYGIS